MIAFLLMFQALSEIGLVIFTALDFGLGQDQERALSEDLETLLDLLASEGRTQWLKLTPNVSYDKIQTNIFSLNSNCHDEF